MNKFQEEVLEASTNTHKMVAQSIVKEDLGNSILKLKVTGEGIVSHGEHGVLKTESENVIKYVQQEVNPITQKLQNAFD
jgi:hypothetical protein